MWNFINKPILKNRFDLAAIEFTESSVDFKKLLSSRIYGNFLQLSKSQDPVKFLLPPERYKKFWLLDLRFSTNEIDSSANEDEAFGRIKPLGSKEVT